MSIDNFNIDSIKYWLSTGSINIFGKPFAGKDTQARKLVEILDGNLMGGGDILRNSVIPQRCIDALEAGHLIPSEDYVDIVLPYLKKPEFAKQPLVLSSVGRWSGEEHGVMKALQESGHPLKLVVNLQIDDSECFKRYEALKVIDDRNRDDDNSDTLETRLKEYHSKTEPVLDFYRQNKMLLDIDGTGSREKILDDILHHLAVISSYQD